MAKYICSVCGFVYDEAKGIPDAGIAAGTRWEDLPEDWVCPHFIFQINNNVYLQGI